MYGWGMFWYKKPVMSTGKRGKRERERVFMHLRKSNFGFGKSRSVSKMVFVQTHLLSYCHQFSVQNLENVFQFVHLFHRLCGRDLLAVIHPT